MSEGERDLGRLLAGLEPRLDAERWRFCLLSGPPARDLEAIATVTEDEGVTAIVPEARATGRVHPTTFRRITLTVHSSLEAVGLLATVSATLAEAGISCNVLSAFHHDQLFVPERDAERALALLERLAQPSSGAGRDSGGHQR